MGGLTLIMFVLYCFTTLFGCLRFAVGDCCDWAVASGCCLWARGWLVVAWFSCLIGGLIIALVVCDLCCVLLVSVGGCYCWCCLLASRFELIVY